MSLSNILAATIGGLSALIAAAAAAQPVGDDSLPTSIERAPLIAWIRAATDLDPGAVISVKPSALIAIMSVQRPDPASSSPLRVQMRAEQLTAQVVGDPPRRSWAADVEVDCPGRRAKVDRILDFPLRNLQGTPRESSTSAQWLTPPPGAHLYNLIGAVCDADYQRPLAGDGEAAARSPPASPLPARSAPALARHVEVAPTSPIATALQPVEAAPAPEPVRAPAIAAPPKAAPPPRPAPSPRKPAPPIKAALQITASDSEKQASDSLKVLRRKHAAQMQGLSTAVAPVNVSGKTFYRALVQGFGSQAEALALCKAIKASGQDCLLRPDGGRD